MNLMNANIYKIFLLLFLSCSWGTVCLAGQSPETGKVAIEQGGGAENLAWDAGTGSYSVRFNAGGENAGDHADAFFSTYGLTNWSGYDVFSVHVENTSDDPVNVGLQVKLSPLVVLRAEAGKPCFWRGDGEDLQTVALPVNGMVEIGPKESGQLIVPFSSLAYKNRHFPIGYFTAWNFRVNALKDAQVDVKFGDFTLYMPGEIILPEIKNDGFLGDDVIQIPLRGAESIAVYQLKDRAAFFRLAKAYTGIELTEDGRLTVSAEAQPQIIKVFAEFGDVRIVKNITLKVSDKAGVVDKDGEEPLLPAPETLHPIFDRNNLWAKDQTYVLLRWGCLFVALFGLSFFLYGNYRYEEKLHKENETMDDGLMR